jgi:hypothetical protein
MSSEPMNPRKTIRWRRVAVAYVAGGLVCGGLYLAALKLVAAPEDAAAAGPQPQVVVGHTQHDFGAVAAGQTLRHRFAVKNRGRTRIVLNRDTCGDCGDDPQPGHIILGPGEETEIPVVLKTTGKTGPLRRVLQITTSDPRLPKIRFTVTAQVGGNTAG